MLDWSEPSHLSQDDIVQANRLARKRSGVIPKALKRNSRNFFAGKPEHYRDVVGAYAEVAYARKRGYPVHDLVDAAGDGGVDFPDGADVKGSPHSRPRVMIPLDQWERIGTEKKRPDFYVLASVNVDQAEVAWHGWIPHEEFAEHSKVGEFGRGPTRYVERDRLHGFPKGGR